MKFVNGSHYTAVVAVMNGYGGRSGAKQGGCFVLDIAAILVCYWIFSMSRQVEIIPLHS